MSDAEDSAYRVGRGRPPLHSRFKPGRSGNPRGRPKGRKTLGTILDELLDRKITVGVGPTRRKLTAREAILMQQLQGALKGDRKAAQFLLSLTSAIDAAAEPEPHAASEDDAAVLARFLEKLRPDDAP